MDTRENRRPYSRGPYLSDVLEVKDVVEGEGADGASLRLMTLMMAPALHVPGQVDGVCRYPL